VKDYTVTNEKKYIDGLGKFTDLGKEIGRQKLLENYIKALNYPSVDGGWTPKEKELLIAYIKKGGKNVFRGQ